MVATALTLFGLELPPEVVLLGAITGITYGLFAVGLTLVYQNTRVLNFAQGAMGAVPHIVVASMVVDHGHSYWVALPLGLAAGAASGALLQATVIRRLRSAPRLVVLVATIAGAQILTAPMLFLLDLSDSRMAQSEYPTPFHLSWRVGALQLGAGHLLILLVAPLAVLALTLFLRRTSLGQASRAMAENEEAAELSGIATGRVSLAVWAAAGLLAALAAILAGPTRPILSVALGQGGISFSGTGDLMLRGLGAAMMGGLVSLPQVFVAGIGLGVIEATVRWNYPSGGLLEVVVAAVVVGSLLLRRDLRQAARGGEETSWSLAGAATELPAHVRRLPIVRALRVGWYGLVLGVAVLAAIVASPGHRILYSAILVYMLIALSMVVLTGWAGQVSLGHFTFAALGAMVGGRMHQLGYPVAGSLIAAAVVGGVAALVVGVPALRIRGLFLAVSTLAFAVVADSWLVRQTWFVKQDASSSSLTMARPQWGPLDLENELTFFLCCLALVVVSATGIRRFRSTGAARRLIAARDNEVAAAALSISPAGTKLMAFVLSGVMASVAGYLYGMLLVVFRTAGLTSISFSQAMVTMVVFGGATSVTGGILGALYVRGMPYFVSSAGGQLLTSGFGLLAVLLFIPGGLASVAFRLRDRVVRRVVGAERFDGSDPGEAPTRIRLEPRAATRSADDAPALEAEGVVVRYGGLTAVDDVTITVGRGEIVGLIGPNGAGKTTLFDVLSGQVTPAAGRVRLHGVDITGLRPEQRALVGLGRSFQQARLFDGLTVLETLALPLERTEPSEAVPSLLALPPSIRSEAAKRLRANELVELLGLGAFAEKRCAELSTGTRRVVELGALLALGCDVVLLDEPTGGIAQREVEAFTPLLRGIRDHLDASMVVVAHDIPMVTELVDRLYVLAAGRVLHEGTPADALRDPAVVAAYLGADADTVATAAVEHGQPVPA